MHADMNEPKTKKKIIRVTLQPVMRALVIETGGNFNGSLLGDILLRMAREANPGNTSLAIKLTLTKERDFDYVRGLADGRVMHADRLAKDLEKAGSVLVTFLEEDAQ
jgi:hypothetical protein